MNICIAEVLKSIAPNCNNPIVGGYTGRCVLIPVNATGVVVTQDADNPRIIEAIKVEEDTVVGIYNAYATPFDGTSTQSSSDSGRIQYTKTFSFRIPLRGAGTSKDIVEPLVNSTLGFFAVLEKKDKVGDGSFEVVGYQQGLKVTEDGVVRNESENGGDIVFTMSCTEPFFESVFFADNYEDTLKDFEILFNSAK